MDEPLSNLDAKLRTSLRVKIAELHKQGNTTTIYVTHDQEEAFFLSDRIMVMNEGNIEQIDSPLELYKNPANTYVKEFVVDQLDKKYFDMLKYTGRDQ